MDALFIGQSYIDVTFLIDTIPSGDDKAVARDYAVSFGGNAVSAAFCCAKLGVVPDLMASLADDWLARMFLDMAAKYGISVHGRKVKESSVSFVMPHKGMRAIIRCRDDDYLHPVPPLDLSGCRALHLDGHQADAAIQYAKACRAAGILTSLDGGGMRSNTMELLEFVDVAICSQRMCEQLGMSPAALCQFLRHKGVKVGGVTLGDHGMLWSDEHGNVRHMPALVVPKDEVIVCRCEEVTAGELRSFVKLGCLGPNQAKSFGRCGMGPCQGRLCGLTVTEVIADARNVAPATVGYYRIRPPIKQLTLGELAGE